MKKTIIIMGLLSFLLGCNRYRKIYLDDKCFEKEEKMMNISSEKASSIYIDTFHKNFDISEKERAYNNKWFYKVIYMYNKFYYIGFANKNDKRDEKTAPLYFLAKINSETGEISVVK